MDPLSISASVAGLLTLAEGVFGTIFRYVKSAKNAEKEITQLRDAVQALCGVLARLKLIINELEDIEGSKPARSQLMESCSQTLTKLNAKLNKVDSLKPGSSKIDIFKRKIQWPFAMNETKELLTELERHKSSLTAALSVDTLDKVLEITASHVEAKKQLRAIQDELQRIKLDKDREEIFNVCGAFDPLPNHQYGVENRQSGTGLWLTQGTAFQDWLASRNHMLWISGIPGAGKTVLAALSIQETLSHVRATTALGFYYCDYKKVESQDPVNVLNSLAAQLAWQSEQCYELLREACLSNAFNGKPSKIHNLQLLHNLLVKMASKFEEVSIITDGLDECGDKMNDMAQVLANLSHVSTSTIKVLLFSRNEQQIRDVLLAEPPQSSFEHVEIAATSEDLGLYVAAELGKRIKSRHLRIKNLALQAEIQQKLVEKAAGMFRWVTCQLDYLCQLRTDRERREALDQLPPTLKSTYKRILKRVAINSYQNCKLVKTALSWILYAREPLTTRALCQALSIEETSKCLDAEGEPSEEDILASCSSFIRLASEGSHLESAHFTVQEFFESIEPNSSLGFFRLEGDAAKQPELEMPILGFFHLNRDVAELEMSKTCLRYLQLEEFHRPWFEEANRIVSEIPVTHPVSVVSGLSSEKFEFLSQFVSRRHSNLPFLGHAAQWWTVYARDRQDDSEIFALEQQLFHPPHSDAFLSWTWEYLMDFDPSGGFPRGVTQFRQNYDFIFHGSDFDQLLITCASFEPLHLACHTLLVRLANWLLESGCDRNQTSALGSPLALSVQHPNRHFLCEEHEYEYLSIVVFWDKNSRFETVNTANRAIFALLVESGADLTRLEYGRNAVPLPLIWSALWSQEFSELLLRAGALMSKDLIDLLRTSCLASDEYRFHIAELLSAVPDINVDEDDKEALLELISLAGSSGVEDIIQQHHSVALQTSHGQSNKRLEHLVHAARLGTKRLFLDLLGAPKLDLGVVDDHTGKSALHIAVAYGAVHIVSELLSQGAEPNMQDKEGRCPVHCCITDTIDESASQIFDLLCAHGSVLEQADELGVTVWHFAALHDRVQILEKLQKMVPDHNFHFNHLTTKGHTPFEYSFMGPSIQAFQYHLQAPEAAASFTADPIPLLAHIPAEEDNVRVVPFLQALLKQGLSPDVRLSDGSTVLHLCVLNFIATSGTELTLGNDDWDCLFEDLVKQGVDPTSPRDDGKLPLHLFCDIGTGGFYTDRCRDLSDRILRTLGNKATVNAQDHNGVTAVHLLCDPDDSSLYDTYWLDRFASFEYLLSLQSQSSHESSHVNPHVLSYMRMLAKTPRRQDHQDQPICNMLRQCVPFLSAQDLASSALADLSLVFLAKQDRLYTDFLEELFEAGVSVDVRRSQQPRYSALELACMDPTVEPKILRAILKRTHCLHRKHPRGLGLIHLTCNVPDGNETTLHALVQAGVDCRERTAWNDTALMFAAGWNNMRQIDFLLANGADINATDDNGMNSAHSAAFTDSVDALIRLEHAGIDLSATCNFDTGLDLILQGATILHIAARNESYSVVEHLVNSPCQDQLHVTAGDNLTPFLLAAQAGHSTILEILASKGAAIDALSSRGLSALHLAAENMKLDAVRVLLKLGCDPSLRDQNAISPVLYALRNEHTEMVELLRAHEKQRDDDKERTKKYTSSRPSISFRQSIINGDLAMCKAMVSAGECLEQTFADCQTCTPLLTALQYRQGEIVRFLFDEGATIEGHICSEHGSEGWTVFHQVMCNKDMVDVLRLLLSRKPDGFLRINTLVHPVHIAAASDNWEGLQLAFDILLGVNPPNGENDATKARSLPATLQTSTTDGLLSSLVHLQLGCEISSMMGAIISSGTCLHIAACTGSVAVAQVIHAHGALVDDRDGSQNTPLHLAVAAGQHEMVTFLLENGASLHARGMEWRTPLLIAAEFGNLTIFKTLLSYGADPTSESDRNAMTALHLAASTEKVDFLAFLLGLGLDLHMKDAKGRSAADYSLMYGNSELATLVLNSSSPWERSEMHGTPLLHPRTALSGFGPTRKRIFRWLLPHSVTEMVNHVYYLTPKTSPLSRAVTKASISLIEVLLDAGAELEPEDWNLTTPLVLACTGGYLPTIETLVRRGALLAYAKDDQIFNGIEAAENFPNVVHWLLVGRHSSQHRLNSPDQSSPHAEQDIPLLGGRQAILQYWKLGKASRTPTKREEEERYLLKSRGPFLMPWK